MNIIDIYHFHALFFNQFYRLLKMLETKLTGASSFLLRFIWNYVFVLSVCPSVRLSIRPSVRHTVCQRNSSETTEQNFMKLGR
jgi:hypothetical protein